VVRGGRGSSREESTKGRGGGGKEEIGGAGDETGERRQAPGAATAE